MTHGIDLRFDSCNRHAALDAYERDEAARYDKYPKPDAFTPIPIAPWMSDELVAWVTEQNAPKVARLKRIRADQDYALAVVEALNQDLDDVRTGGSAVGIVEHNGHAPGTNGHAVAGSLAVANTLFSAQESVSV